ncbi:CHAP domain-containing protein [Daejeonella sp. JGW-45]|uniref:CHAP domain-containing protein n=1 Tax=Daejeonella sp. JGW-45 TaxID=3034148 RepID=UPI0023ED5794|nr:CHAP domain-containing protein [Daejeonella sp. JGW-45]
MKTDRLQNGAVWFYGPIFLIVFTATVYLSLVTEAAGLQESPARFKIRVKAKEVQRIYTSQLGVREKASNSGPAVEQYLRYVNLPKGNPWCAAFVCWVLGKAGVDNPRTGWSPALFPAKRVIWERAKRELKPDSYREGDGTRGMAGPRMGDVFGIYFPEKGRIAHVGFVDEWDGTWVLTVEGNTNGEGEGSLASPGMTTDGVYRKRRLVRSVFRVARYVE